MTGPDLRHPVSLRGIDSWLDRMADSLTAKAELPIEVRDIAYSLRARAAAIRRDPEYAATAARLAGGIAGRRRRRAAVSLLCRAGRHRWRPATDQEIAGTGYPVPYAERCARCLAWSRPPQYLAAAIRNGGYRGGQPAGTMGPPPQDVPSAAHRGIPAVPSAVLEALASAWEDEAATTVEGWLTAAGEAVAETKSDCARQLRSAITKGSTG